MNYEGPGIYRHYKGGEYVVLGTAVREETIGEEEVTDVVYCPVKPYNRDQDFVTRVLEVFNEQVEGTEVEIGGPELEPRFKKIGELP